MKPRKPVQFSLATLMLAMTGYSLFFGFLRVFGLTNFAFVIITLFVTTVVYSQWALLNGCHPYWSSVLASISLLSVVFATLAWQDLPHRLWFTTSGYISLLFECLLMVVFQGCVWGGIVGVLLAAVTDSWLLLMQTVRGTAPKIWEPDWSPFAAPRTADSADEGRSTRGRRLVVLAVLAGILIGALLWGIGTRQQWMIRRL